MNIEPKTNNTFFSDFFTLLDLSGITYGITGRTEDYPNKIDSDIDIIIPNSQFPKFWSFMSQLNDSDIKWIQTISHEQTAHYCIITKSDVDTHQILKPDVCSDYYRKAKLFLKADYLLENKVFNDKGFFQLAPDKEFIYYLLKKIDKGYININQFAHICSQWESDSNGCKITLSQHFSTANRKLIENLIKNNDFKGFKNRLSYLKEDLHKNLKFSFKDSISKISNRIHRLINPTGLVIAFMGPDGSGKTTIIEGVKRDLTGAFRQNRQYHLFPKRMKDSKPNVDPHAEKPRGFFSSILKLLYFVFIYNFGYWKLIFPEKIKSTMVIFDRYFQDLIIDPRRYRHGAGSLSIKIASYLIPKPDLWIFLDAPAEVIQDRKSEVPLDETERQLISYKLLFSNLKNAFIVNAGQSPEKVIYDTESIIIDFMEKRNAKRYKRRK